MATGTVHKRKQRRIAILTTLALGLSLLGISFQIPAAANLPFSSFDAGDGNETVEIESPPETDWASPAPGLVTQDDVGSGAADNSISGNEDGVKPTITLGSVQGNKADLTKIRVAHERTATGLDFLYLAWNRPADPSGNVDFDFELNKLAQPTVPAAGQVWNLKRSPGDILLTFELVGGGTTPILSLRKWVATGNKSLCDSNPSTPCWGPATVLDATTTPAAEGSVNPGINITFGEMAVNLGLAGIFTPGQCTSFASVYAKTRSSGSGFNSQISDLVAPVQKSISNCGKITVTKTVAGTTVTGDATSFAFSVDCGTGVDLDVLTAGTQRPATFSLLHGESKTINDIPVGSNCTVTETMPTPTSHWTVSHNATATSDANVAAVNNVPLAGSSVTFTNTRNSGAMAVSKTSTGGTGTFVFAVDCNDGTVHDRLDADKISITTTAAGTAVTSSPITGIPTGTVCTVTEDPHSRFSPTTPSPSSGQVTIDADSSTTQTVAFTNIRRVADLTVDKLTTGGTGSFRFTVDCNDGTVHDRTGDDRLSITNTNTASVTGIPTGTSCTVTETPHADFNSSLRSPSSSNTVTISDTGATIYFQNTRKTGTLTVSKSRTGGSATDVFTFEVDCTDNTFDRKGAQALTITGSGSATVTDIPTGTSCVVTETTDDRYASTRTPTDGTVILDESGETVSFSNVRNTGTLTISKTTTGGSGTFTFTVDCSDDAFDTTRTITDSNSATVTGIPTGTVCTVTETPDPLFTSTRSPLNGQRTIDANGETVSFENVRKTGSLTIAKTTSGGDGTFRFAVDCTDDRFDRSDVDVLTTSGSGSSAPIAAIPTQTSCTVTETVPAGWAAVGATSKTVVIVGRETASFSNRKLPSGIAVAKTPSAPTVHAGDKVTYTYVVTNTGENPLTSVVVVDDKCAPVVVGSGDTDGDKALDLTEVWTFTCTSTLTATTTNIATATGIDPHGATPTDTDSATVIVIKPAIAIDKTPSANSVEPNTTVVYTYTVTNPGDVPLAAVTVSDDKCSPVTFVRGDVNVDKLLQVGETWVFQCSQIQTGRLDTLTNVGTASGVDALGLKVTSTDTVSISVVAPSVIVRPAPEVVTAPAVVAAPATLPRTGSDARGLLQLAGSLILLGLALVLTAGPVSRLRRH